MATPCYFLSYKRQDLTDITLVGQILMLYGIRLWQDISNLGTGQSEETIRTAILKQTCGFVFFSSNESVNSEFIRKVELPTAESRFKADNTYHIIPIFKLPRKETDQALNGVITFPISSFNGAEVHNGAVEEAAHQAASIILGKIGLPSDTPLKLGVASKQKTARVQDVALDVDFTPYFKAALPSEKDWQHTFPKALVAVKNYLVEKGVRAISINSFAHLSLGFLFCYIFRERTGITLNIVQANGDSWRSDEHPDTNPLSTQVIAGSPSSDHLCVKINLTAKTDDSVRAYLARSNLSFRAILELSAPTQPFMITGPQALGIANHIITEIKRLHSEYQTRTVHIFAAIPLGLAFFIGYKANACGKILCYEFNDTREYVPSVVLDGKN